MTRLSWKLETLGEDSDYSHTFVFNPNEMDPPELPYANNSPQPSTIKARRVAGTHQLEPHTKFAVLASQAEPIPWTFSGTVYSLDEIEALSTFMSYGQLKLTDHFNRGWKILLQDFDIRRAPWPHYPERHKYEMHCLMLGRLS